jgi:small ligand-binding sensory domain FIST
VGAGVHADAAWSTALERAAAQALADMAEPPDLVALFASGFWAAEFDRLVRRAHDLTDAGVLIGCSGGGVIGPGTEVEDRPALSLLALALPGALLHPVHLTHDALAACATADDVRRLTGAPPDDVEGFLVLADPFRLDAEGLLRALAGAYPDVPLIGGLASSTPSAQTTHVFMNERSYDQGAVCLAIGGAYTLRTLVSQGCQPIGQPWTITAVERNVIATIGNRPAYEVLVETFNALPPADQQRARRNLLVGLAIDERRDDFGRGDFLIRTLMGADRRSGALAIGALPRVGQTIQFQLRDAAAADEDLRTMLAALDPATHPAGAILCSCNGRGAGLFGAPHHDAQRVAERLGPLPLAGLFCNGEIGPIGGRPFVHGFTASLGLIVPKR